MALGMRETLSIGLGVIVLNGVLWSHSCWMSAIVCIRCLYDMVCIFTQGREKNFWNVFWKFFNEVHMNNTHSASRCKQLVLKLRMQRLFRLCTRNCGWHSFMSKLSVCWSLWDSYSYVKEGVQSRAIDNVITIWKMTLDTLSHVCLCVMVNLHADKVVSRRMKGVCHRFQVVLNPLWWCLC